MAKAKATASGVKIVITDGMLRGWGVTRKEFQDGLLKADARGASAEVDGKVISSVVRAIRNKKRRIGVK